MGQFSLPEHLIAWCQTQIELDRFVNIDTYVAQLVTEDMHRAEAMNMRRQAVLDARESGISMRDPDSILAQWVSEVPDARAQGLRDAIRLGREEGYSLVTLEGILSRATSQSLLQNPSRKLARKLAA